MIQDFRFAFRQLVTTPGFTIIALLTLALAIGVNSAVFSLINGVVLRPVVRVRPAEVVGLFTARQNANRDYGNSPTLNIRSCAKARMFLPMSRQ